MTREEAIDRLMWLKSVPHINDDKWIEAVDMAIEALTADAVPQMEHDREWIIGCIKHDGFIKTDRFDKANQIILEALSADAVQGFRGGKIPPKEMLDGTVLIPKHQWLEMERELAELKEKFESADAEPNEDLVQRSDVLEIISEAQDGSGSTYEILQPIFEKVNGMPSCHRCYECDEALLNHIEDSVKEEVLHRMLEKGCIEFPKDLMPSEVEVDYNIEYLPKNGETHQAKATIKGVSADAVQGEWIIRENGNKECSLCGHERQDGWDYFCGYCGARIKGGAE